MCIQHFSFPYPKSCFTKSPAVELMPVFALNDVKIFLIQLPPQKTQKVITNIIIKFEQNKERVPGL
jgi:hypothetical protein